MIHFQFGAFFKEGGMGVRGDRAYVREQCLESLKNLEVDSIGAQTASDWKIPFS